MPILTSSEVLEAYTVFQNASGLGWPRARIEFFKIVSIKNPIFNGVLTYSLTEAEAKRIEMLNGPHGYTYAKALIAQVTDGKD